MKYVSNEKKSGCLGYIGDEILLNCVGIVRIPMKNNQYYC